MPDRTYTIANCVDTVIVLRNPFKDFAVWKQDQPETSPTVSNEDTSTSDDVESAGSQHLSISDIMPGACEDINVLEGVAAINLAETDRGEVSLFSPGITPSEEPVPAIAQPLAAPVDGIHYLCSSAHLKQSSAFFNKALSAHWTESSRRDDGRYYMIFDAEDEDALLIVPNVLHLRHKQVLKQIDLEKLAMIAALVDFFKCHEAVDLYHPLWIRNLTSGRTSINRRHKIRPVYDRDVMMWLCVAWVFKQDFIFQDITRWIIHEGELGPMCTLGLPIPVVVEDCILEGRDKALQLLAQALTEQLDSLAKDPDLCNDSPFFRNLTCRLQIIEEVKEDLACYGVDPQAARPFEGRIVKDVLGIFQGMQQAYKHSCGGKTRLNFELIAEDISGVSLFDCYREEENEDYNDLADGWYAERDV